MNKRVVIGKNNESTTETMAIESAIRALSSATIQPDYRAIISS